MQNLSITTIQSILHWEDIDANLAMFESKLSAINPSTDIVILPEMFSTGFSMNAEALAESMDGKTVNWMLSQAKKFGFYITGSVIIKEEGRYYNRLFLGAPNGDLQYYDKRHLFTLAKEERTYTAGTKKLIADIKGWKVNLQVCYDLRFPVWARNTIDENGNAEYDLLVYVANWPNKRSNAWRQLLAARAIENQCYVVGVNRVGEDGNDFYFSGDTSIIDPLGEVLYHKADDEDVFTVELDEEHLRKVRRKLSFLKDGDSFSINI